MRHNGSLFQSAPSLVFIILFGLLLWGGEYVRRDLWEPDEARFALVSGEMREGHWLVPFRQGEFYSHKPPLMFWLTNLFSRLNGGEIGNVAPRFPSFLGAIMALWAATRLAAQWFSTRTAWFTLLILPSSYLFWNKGGFGQIDMLLCGLEMMALYFFFTTNHHSKPAIRLVMAYFFMGLAIITKGPVGFLVPWGAYIAATLAAREPLAKPKSHWIWGPLITLAIPGLWLGLAWWQGAPEGFFNELLFKQNLGRVAGEFGGHQQPFYYFLYYFPMDFLPWTILLPLSWVVLRKIPEVKPHRLKLLAWILFVVVFFSLSASKRNLYILLCYPAAAILLAAAIEHWQVAGDRWLRVSFWCFWSLLALLGGGMVIGSFVPGIPFNALTLLPGGLALTAGCWLALQYWRSDPQQPNWLVILGATLLVTFASIGALVYPAINDLKTPNELVEPAKRLLAPDDRLVVFKMQGEIFSLYAERKGVMILTTKDLVTWLKTSDQSNQIIVCLDRERPSLERLLDARYEVVPFTTGSKKMIYVPIEGPVIFRN